MKLIILTLFISQFGYAANLCDKEDFRNSWRFDEFSLELKDGIVLDELCSMGSSKTTPPFGTTTREPYCGKELILEEKDLNTNQISTSTEPVNTCFIFAKTSDVDVKKMTVQTKKWKSVTPDLSIPAYKMRYSDQYRGPIQFSKNNKNSLDGSIFLHCFLEDFKAADGAVTRNCKLVEMTLAKYGLTMNKTGDKQIKTEKEKEKAAETPQANSKRVKPGSTSR